MGVLDWSREKGVEPASLKPVPDFDKLPSKAVSRKTPEDRKKDVEDVVDWLRSGKPVTKDIEETFETIDQLLPEKPEEKPQDRAKDIESVVDWCREKGVSPASLKPVPDFDKVPSKPVSRKSPEDRKKDVEDIVDWLRSGKPVTQGTEYTFKNIDQ